jgi:NAD(P)-dependent dehydrogenase (short-subunit alcohol dehydrogenase family)
MVTSNANDAGQAGDLAGTVVLMSGSGRGLGRLLAIALARAGASVGLLARSSGELAAVVGEIERAGGTAAAATADVTDRDVLRAAVKKLQGRLGPVDVLINNAGVAGPIGASWDVDPDEWWRAFEVNAGGAFALTRMILPDMIAAGRGRILNITSNAGIYRWPLMSAYATSKAAVIKMTENIATEAVRHGVTVLSVDPGLLPIGLTKTVLSGTADPATAEARVAAWVHGQFAAGQGADPDQAVRLIVDLARGRGDVLSGRHLSPDDDLAALVEKIDWVREEDLNVLRLRRGI